MWQPRRLTTLWDSTADYRGNFFLPIFHSLYHECWGNTVFAVYPINKISNIICSHIRLLRLAICSSRGRCSVSSHPERQYKSINPYIQWLLGGSGIEDHKFPEVCSWGSTALNSRLLACICMKRKYWEKWVTLYFVGTGRESVGNSQASGSRPSQITSKVKRMESYPCNRTWRSIGLWDVEVQTFSLDNRLTDGGEFVSLTPRPPFTLQEYSWYSFLLEAESTPGPQCGWKN
jgi:hypothetical protein